MKSAHNTDIDLSFYNDRVKEVMDATTMAEPFTYIPITAGHMELVGGNALVFGKIKEGYDIINPSIKVEISYEDVSSGIPRIGLDVSFVQTYIDIETREMPGYTAIFRILTGVVVISIPTTIYIGSTYYIDVTNASELLGPLTASYTAIAGNTYVEVIAGLKASLIAQGVNAADIEVGADPTKIYLFERDNIEYQESPYFESGDVNDYYSRFTIRAYILTLGYTIKFPILKCGATHGFGIVYKDRSGRQCSVVKTDDMDVYIPFYAEETLNLLDTIAKLKFKIYHQPPSWAETYEIVYYGNLSMDLFVQIRADDITSLGNDRFSLNIQNTFEYNWLQNARWKVPTWTWQAGDRIRLIGTVNVGTGVITKYTTLYDYEIEETGSQDGSTISGDWLWFQAVERPVPLNGATNILVEVYQPRKGLGQIVPYGTGMVFDIGTDANGNKYHKGDVDQIISASGICTTVAEVDNTKVETVNELTVYTIRANDSWKFIRLNYEYNATAILPFWAESYFPSDWWDDQTVSARLTSIGFPFVDDLSLKQTVLDERMRHGGYLITGTRTNNIAHFTYADFLDLPKKNGDITGLREVGYTLKAIQMHKETSIYINRIQTFNPDGTEQFTLTDAFFGTTRPMETDYGCQHPHSIMVNGRNLYYWDNNEGALIRSAPNGQIVLSGPEYKMSRWFKDLLEWIRSSGGRDVVKVNIGANNDHEEVWITFNINDVIEGVIFSEKQGRFVSRINQITENYLHLGNFFAHLYHQRLWIMNIDEGQKWLTWVGVPTYAEVEVVSNIESTKNKVFNAVAQFADHLLQSLAKYIHIPKIGRAHV